MRRLPHRFAVVAVLMAAQPAGAAPVAVDTAGENNGITDVYSATFDGALTVCQPSDPSWCSFFNGKPGPTRQFVISPSPTRVVAAVPAGITPVPASGSYLDLALNGDRTQLTLAGGTLAFPALTVTIQGNTTVNVAGAGIVLDAAPQYAAVDTNGRAEFLVNLSPAIAADFSTFSTVAFAPYGSCSGPLCALVPILTLDMVRYRLVIDYDATFTSFTATFIGETGNNSLVYATLNSIAGAPPIPLRMDAHNQRSSSGVLSTLKWKTCTPLGSLSPCLSTTNAWTLANAMGSDAAWTWNPATGVLAMTGTFQTTSFISSNSNGSPVVSDKVVNLTIDTVNNTTTAGSYNCIEGNFLLSVGANGCLNTSTGGDFVNDSAAQYNVGGDATCVGRTVGGDDQSTGNPRGLMTLAGGGPCDPVDGAFDVWVVEQDNTAIGGQLIIRNDVPINQAGTNFLTFTAIPAGAVDDAVQVQVGSATAIPVLANDVGYTDPVTVTINAPPAHGTAVVSGSPGPQAGIAIVYTPAPGYGGPDGFTYRAVGGIDDTADVVLTVLDLVPDAFAFAPQSGVALGALVTSNAITVSGLSTATTVSVTNGQYSLGCTGSYTGTAGTVTNGQTVCVRHTSAATPATDTVTMLTIGGVAGTFVSTTALPDTVPNQFTFLDQAGVPLASAVTSGSLSISGINSPAAISVTGGLYSINGGNFVSSAGTVQNGGVVRVRHTSSPAPGTAVDTVLTVGGVSDTFTSTTVQFANDDSEITAINQPALLDVLANDFGLAANVYVGIWIDPSHGTASVSGAPGSPTAIRVNYTPAPGYVGPDTLEYWVETGLIVDYGRVDISVVNGDSDGDGVVDLVDNCTLVANASQCDSDGDGYGNRCDGDLTNNGATNGQDSVVLRSRMGAVSSAPGYNAADLNCNGFVNAQDTVLQRQLLGSPPGPSGLHP